MACSALTTTASLNPVVGPPGDDLVDRCAAGDNVAWGNLYDNYQPAARAFLRRMGVAPDSLDDVCQEVFLEAFRYLPHFRGDCSFKTWLYRLCATQARKARMRRRIQQTLLAMLPGEVFRTVGEVGHSEGDAENLIHRGLSCLNDKERLVFVLYEIEGLPGREIIKIADCPDATLWRRLHYARKKFAAAIEGQGTTS
jgi:RNA polymerase sigma-70 factor (ECF subfamily)